MIDNLILIVAMSFFSGFGAGTGFYSWLMYPRFAEMAKSITTLAQSINDNTQTIKTISEVLTK